MNTLNWIPRTSRASWISTSGRASRVPSPSRPSSPHTPASSSSSSSRHHSRVNSMSSGQQQLPSSKDRTFRHGIDAIKFAEPQARPGAAEPRPTSPAHSTRSMSSKPVSSSDDAQPGYAGKIGRSEKPTDSRFASKTFFDPFEELDRLGFSQVLGKPFKSRKPEATAGDPDKTLPDESLDQPERTNALSEVYEIPREIQLLIDQHLAEMEAGAVAHDTGDDRASAENQTQAGAQKVDPDATSAAVQDAADPSETVAQATVPPKGTSQTEPLPLSRPRIYTYTLYKSPSNATPPRDYVRTLADAERVARLFLNQPLLALDTEWLPKFIKIPNLSRTIKHEVSVIQIASASRIAIFHLARFAGSTPDSLVPPTLRRILEDESVYKVGVNVLMDANRISQFLRINSRGLFELSHLHNLLQNPDEGARLSLRVVRLARQVEEHLGLTLPKESTRTSNWSAPLDEEQLTYAANDVYASIKLFERLNAKRLALNPVPPLPPTRHVATAVTHKHADDARKGESATREASQGSADPSAAAPTGRAEETDAASALGRSSSSSDGETGLPGRS